MDDTPAIAYTPPPPGWARIELEPVDIPIEQDESVILSAIQSVIPGAHGLYYKDGDRRKALRYDGSTGRIAKGSPGWNTKPIYVVLAHGCRHYAGGGTGQYDIASERFERTINLIQRMLAGFDRWGRYPYGGQSLTRTADRKRGGDKQARDDKQAAEGGQAARVDEGENSDGSIDSGKCSKVSSDFQKLQDENDSLKQRVEDLLIETGYLKGQQMTLQSQLPMYPPMFDTTQEKETVSKVEFEKMKQAKEQIERQLDKERGRIASLEKARNDLEWRLGEHTQWLNDAQARIKDLERMLDEERNKAQSLTYLNVELNTKLGQLQLGQQPDTELNELREKLYHKQMEIDNLNKRANDVEWSLGEHKQWLQDANNRANYLDGLCQEKQRIIEDLSNKLRDAEQCLSEISITENIEQMRSTLENLRKDIDRKNEYIGELEKARNDAQWSLGEHQQWLEHAKDRIGDLEKEKAEAWKRVGELEQKLSELGIVPNIDEFNQMKATIEELWQQLHDKNRECEELNKMKNEAEWHLSEHRSWLQDANDRIQSLEDKQADRDRFVAAIDSELADLKKIRTDTFQQLHNKIGNLDVYLNEKECLLGTEPSIENVEYNMLLAQAKGLKKDIDDKDRLLLDLKKSKDDAEWHLGEHKRLLEDANNRIKELEEACARGVSDHDDTIRKLSDQINELQSRNNQLQEEMQQKQDALKLLCAEREERTSLSALPEDDQMQKETHRLQVRVDELIAQLKRANEEKELAQRENEELRRALEDLRKNLEDKESQLNALNKLKNDAEWSLGEHKQWLQDSRNRIDELEDAARRLADEKDAAVTKLNEIQAQQPEFNKEEMVKQMLDKEHRINQLEKDSEDKQNEINSLKSSIEDLLRELSEMRRNVADAEQKKNDVEWSLGEHRQWLQDANSKALTETIEDLQKQLDNKNEQIGNIEKQRNDAEWNLGEQRQWLQDANNRISELEAALRDKNGYIDKLKECSEEQLREIENLKSKVVPEEGKVIIDQEELTAVHDKLRDVEKSLAEAPSQEKLNELNSIINGLRNELSDRNDYIRDVEKQRNDAEWKLGEHRQWLQDANNRANHLDGICREKDQIINDLENRLRNTAPSEVVSELQEAVNILRTELQGKNNYIGELEKAKNDKEWSLGEHRQWLHDANNRIKELESALGDVHEQLNRSNQECEQLKAESARMEEKPLEAVHVELVEERLSKDDQISRLNEEINDLKNQIDQKNKQLNDVNKAKNDAEWSLGEHRQWLAEANNRLATLEETVKQKDDAIERLRKNLEDELHAADEGIDVLRDKVQCLQKKLGDVERSLSEAPNPDDYGLLNQLVSDIYTENMRKNSTIDELTEGKKNAEVDLEELRKELADTKDRIGDLEVIIVEKDANINVLRNELEDFIAKVPIQDEKHQRLMDQVKVLEAKLSNAGHSVDEAPKCSEIDSLTNVVDQLQKEITLKNDYIGDLEKRRNDAEWSLGEHRQWLQDANNRADGLAVALQEKHKAIDDLRSENETLRKAADEFKDAIAKEIAQLKDNLRQAEERLTRQENTDLLNALQKELDEKNNELCELKKQNEDATWHLGEQKQWLIDAQNKIDGLEQLIREKDDVLTKQHFQLDDLRDRLETEKPKEEESERLRNTVEELEKQLHEKDRLLEELPHSDDVRNLNTNLESLRQDLVSKSGYIADLEKQRNDAQWSLGEHKQWLQDANNRVQDLENTLRGRGSEIDELHKEIERLLADIRSLHETIESLQNKANANNDQINAIEKAKNESDWILGEHKQWLQDANNKVNDLESAVHEKDSAIDELHKNLEKALKELQETKAALVEKSQRTEKEASEQAKTEPHEVHDTTGQVPTELMSEMLKSKINELEKVLAQKDKCIVDLEKQRNDFESKLRNNKMILEGANNKAAYLGNMCSEKDQAYKKLRAQCEELDKKLNEMRLKNNELLVAAPVKEMTPIDDQLRENLRKKDEEIRRLTREKNEAEWNAAECKRLLDDATKRIQDLGGVIDNKGSEIDDLKKYVTELSAKIMPEESMGHVTLAEEPLENIEDKLYEAEHALARAPSEDEINALKARLENIQKDIDAKNDYISNLEKAKSDTDWELEEHKQWLQDANNRVSQLDGVCQEKDRVIQDLENRLRDAQQQTSGEASAEIVNELKVAIDGLRQELNEKDDNIVNLEKGKNDAEWCLGEHRQWLQDANNRIGELTNTVGDKDREIADLHGHISELSRQLQDLKSELEAAKGKEEPGMEIEEQFRCLNIKLAEAEEALAKAHKDDDINALKLTVEELLKQVDGKNSQIDDLEKQKNVAEWSLGEHRQWLQDANNRVAELDNCLRDRNNIIDELQKKIEALQNVQREAPELETWVNLEVSTNKEKPTTDEGSEVHATIDELRKELDSKDDYIQQLIKQRNDAEWSLGEHKQWLNDTKNWAQSLANDLGIKDKIIEDLRTTLKNVQRAAEEERAANKDKIENLEKKLAVVEHFAPEADQQQDISSLNLTVAELRQQIESKKNEIRDLTKQRNDAEWSLGEHRQWLQDANYRAAGLESDLRNKHCYIEVLQTEIDNLRRALDEAQRTHEETVRDLETKIRDFGEAFVKAPSQNDFNELKKTIENLRNEMDSKNVCINNLEKAKNNVEWSLGEHRQWLQDANSRVQELENKLKGSGGDAEDLRREIEKLNADIRGFRALLETNESLQKQLNDKNDHINSVKKAKNDAEWSLGEHKQWLQDANDRIVDLEKALSDKNRVIDEMNNKTGQLQSELENIRNQTMAQEATLAEKDRQADELHRNIDDLLKELEDLKNHTVPKDLHDDLQRKLQRLEEATTGMPDADQLINLQSELEILHRNLDAKNDEFKNLEALKNDAEWKLGEHRQWLEDTKNWAISLDNELKNKNNAIGNLEQQIRDRDGTVNCLRTEIDGLREKLQKQEREREAGVKPADFDTLKNENEILRKELDAKNDQLRDLERRLNDMEKDLGDNRQQLFDANNKADSFESLVNEKNDLIDDLSKQIFEKDGEIDKLQKEVEGLQAGLEQGVSHLVHEQFQTTTAPVQQEITEEMQEKLNQYEQLLAEPVDADALRAELENLHQELAARDKLIRSVEKERNDKEWSLGEHRQWLQDSNNRAQDLEIKVKEDEKQIAALRDEISRLIADVNSLNESISSLQKQLADKDMQLGGLEKQKNDAEWSLGEHRQWLQDANNRADGLENALKEKDRLLDNLRKDIDELKRIKDDSEAAYKDDTEKLQRRVEELEQTQKKDSNEDDINVLNAVINNLRSEISEKDSYVGNLEKSKNEAECGLHEHRQWLSDANNKIQDLENTLHDKNSLVNALSTENEQLKNKLHEAERQAGSSNEKDDKISCLRTTLDKVQGELNGKNDYIRNLEKQRNDAEWSLGEHRQWLQDANSRVRDLENVLDDKEASLNSFVGENKQLKNKLHEAEQQVGSLKEKDNEISALKTALDNIQGELNSKNDYIRDLEQQRNDADWKLGEHRQWLQDANDRADHLDDICRDKDCRIADLENQLRDASRRALEAPSADAITELNETVMNLRNELNGKNDRIGKLEKERDDVQASLGEHRQWLQDANKRIAELEGNEKAKDSTIKDLHSEIEELSKKVVLDLKAALEAVQQEKKPETIEMPVEQLVAKLRSAEQALAECPKPDDLICLRVENEDLKRQLGDKSACIDDLVKQRNNNEWSLGEHRQWLNDANDRANRLESALQDKNHEIDELQCENDRLKLDLACATKPDDINNLNVIIENLQKEVADKNNYIGEVEKQRNDAERKLGEHRQWLQDANNRANGLEDALRQKNDEVDGLRQQNDHLEKALAAATVPYDNLKSLEELVGELKGTIEEKNVYIENLEKARNDSEWSLGEHRQWLADANNRVIDLETSNYQKNNVIDALRQELDSLRVQQPQIEGELAEDVPQLLEKVRELEQKLAEAEHMLSEIPKDDGIRQISLESQLTDLNNALREKDNYIGRVEKERNDKEWSLGEHRQWLSDANNRIRDLENEIQRRIEENDAMREGFDNERHNLEEKVDELAAKLRKKEKALDLLRQQHPEEEQHRTVEPIIESIPEEVEKSKLFKRIFELEEKLNELEKAAAEPRAIPEPEKEYEMTITQLRKDLEQKNADLEHAYKERSDLEWFLGEERQRVKDANERIGELLNSLSSKEEALDALSQQNDELRHKLKDVESKLMDATQSSVGPTSSADEARVQQELHALRNELNDLKAAHESVQKACDEAEWYLGEREQQLTETRARIAQLEDELMRTRKESDDALQNLRNEAFELREKNTKLEEAIRKTEVVVTNLKKEAKTSMLILEQTIGPENLEEEFRKLREKYVQLSELLVTTEERLARLQSEAPELADSNVLRKVIENLNEELRQRHAENESLTKQKNDAEWQLGEHREWLRNANNRISNLEHELVCQKEADERALMDLYAENEALKRKNTQIMENVKHLEYELQAIRQSMDGRNEALKEHEGCSKCMEGSEFSYAGSVSEDLSTMSRSIQDLRKELNYQKIIDTLMEQRGASERALDEQKQSLINAYNKIAELEREISKGVPDKQPEIIEVRTDVTKTLQEASKLSRLEYNKLENFVDLQSQLDEMRQQLDEKCGQMENLEKLKAELERNLEEVKNRIEVMSASLDEKQRTINAINEEKNALVVERDALKNQVDELEQRFKAISTYTARGEGLRDECEDARELEVKLHEKEDQLQQITSEMTDKEEEITNLHAVIQELRNEINEKNSIINDLNRITSEKEWSLGEHRQWLADANNKVSYLETELNKVHGAAKSNKEELDRLRSEMDEKNAKISELHNKIAKLESEAIDVQYEKELTPSELKLTELQEKLIAMEEYIQFQNEELERLKQEHAHALEERKDTTPTSPSARSAGFDSLLMTEDYDDLSSELIALNRRKYKLEEKIKQLETELQASRDRIAGLESEQRKTGEEIWLAKERVANQDRELGDLHAQCSWLRDENARLQNQLEEERKRYAETGGVDWSKFDELKSQMRQMEDALRDEKSKVEWRLGEVTQYWNDAKWKIGELEAGMAHKQWLLDQANQKICELDQMYRFRDATRNSLDGAFLIRKQPTGDRYKWRLAMWNENSPDDLRDYRRVWFEITAPTAKTVLLCSSFVNWECFLQCQKFDNEAGKFGVWVDIPPGRYEFVFVVDGNWLTSGNYPTCYNEHGTQNNWIQVD